jgi:hypothetical protein
MLWGTMSIHITRHNRHSTGQSYVSDRRLAAGDLASARGCGYCATLSLANHRFRVTKGRPFVTSLYIPKVGFIDHQTYLVTSLLKNSRFYRETPTSVEITKRRNLGNVTKGVQHEFSTHNYARLAWLRNYYFSYTCCSSRTWPFIHVHIKYTAYLLIQSNFTLCSASCITHGSKSLESKRSRKKWRQINYATHFAK